MKDNKYYKYLTLKHSWEDINCITLLEKIYSEQLNINFSDIETYNKFKTEDSRWFLKYDVLAAMKYWKKIELTAIKEYDILVFKDRKNRPIHFGMYIGSNQFIHIQIGSYCSITDLNEQQRKALLGCYRHEKLV